ncbi:lasso peptide biosynthesis B2 protein [Micromonospora oryzae]|uniref:lasso peptide biosynthesis B2 protein n=1 Tax=Micromonospora sp. DSM 102119 TaxID=3111768 RepID=UPI0031D1AB5E
MARWRISPASSTWTSIGLAMTWTSCSTNSGQPDWRCVEMPVLPDHDVRVSLPQRVLTAVAVAVARRLVRRSPQDLCRLLNRVKGSAASATYAEAKRARDTVLAVSTRCCGRNACLVRSVATVLVCRLNGSWATWCTGVLSAPPFVAHAWVEAEGLPVDEFADGTTYLRICSV